jgi:hypothetical protein
MKRTFHLALLAALFCPGVLLRADQHTLAERFQYGLTWRLTPRTSFKGNGQWRFRDGFNDFYFFKADFGLEYRVNRHFKLPVYYRYVTRELGPLWQAANEILVDPTPVFFSTRRWDLDFRARFEVDLKDMDLQYLRLMPTLTRKFDLRGHPSSLYVYDEYYIQGDSDLRRKNCNPNLISAGLCYGLNPHADLWLYYMLYSYRPLATPYWTHIHQPCVNLNLKF